jgi:hypothetical protein
MNQTLYFRTGSPAGQQLLAACLILRQALRSHRKIELSVPLAVHREVPEALFGAIIYDTLAAEFADLDNRLHIKVRATDHFWIGTPSTGGLE